MNRKRSSVLGTLGWGLAADILLLAIVLLLISLFSFSSISTAYLVAFAVLAVGLISFVLHKRSRK